MVTTSIGDLAGTFAFRARNVALKQDIQRLSTEMTTGAVSDLAKKFSGNMGVISGIDSSLARLKSYDTQTNEAVLFTAAMQASLQNINSLTSDASATLMSANLGGTNTQLSATASDAKHKFEAVIGALNTAAGGRSIFSGVETNSVALADPDVILSALEAATSGAASAQDVVAAVRDWFDDPAGFSAVAYLGGAGLEPANIAAGENADLGITAADPAIRSTLRGLALGALLDRGVLAGNSAEQKSLAVAAGSDLIESGSSRLDLSARLGVTEAQISAAQTRNSNETTSLQIARNDLVSVDAFETATRLQDTQTQLETIYALTARMSRLSLLDYL